MVSAKEILADWIRTFPTFHAYWYALDNLHLPENGDMTPCAVLSRASEFVRERFRDFNEADWKGIASLVSKYFAGGENLRGVLGACFVENLQFEECSSLFYEHADKAVLRHFHCEGRSW